MQQLPDLRALTDEQLNALYARCFKEGHTNLFDPPGFKFGAATLIEREVFRRRLIAEGWQPADSRGSFSYDVYVEFEITKRTEDFHKSDSHYREYSAIRTVPSKNVTFTKDELQHIIEHFQSANDPFVVSLVEKAGKMRDAISN